MPTYLNHVAELWRYRKLKNEIDMNKLTYFVVLFIFFYTKSVEFAVFVFLVINIRFAHDLSEWKPILRWSYFVQFLYTAYLLVKYIDAEPPLSNELALISLLVVLGHCVILGGFNLLRWWQNKEMQNA